MADPFCSGLWTSSATTEVGHLSETHVALDPTAKPPPYIHYSHHEDLDYKEQCRFVLTKRIGSFASSGVVAGRKIFRFRPAHVDVERTAFSDQMFKRVLTVLALRYTRVGREPHEVLPGGPLDVRGDVRGRTHALLLNALVSIRGGIDDSVVRFDEFWQAEAKIPDAVSGTLSRLS